MGGVASENRHTALAGSTPPCSSNVTKGHTMGTVLSEADVQQALHQLSGWKRNGKAIERPFQFENFVKAMEFVNQIAEAAEAVNHHPDILISYNKVTLSLISHDSGGVTQRDIKMATRINELAPPA